MTAFRQLPNQTPRYTFGKHNETSPLDEYDNVALRRRSAVSGPQEAAKMSQAMAGTWEQWYRQWYLLLWETWVLAQEVAAATAGR